ncbi:hypothetical protein HYFRA_00004841 [Hymenoscyphus fraxineus]|uniref:Sulfatase-modifying factor enzyme domain-containing protein n=1 Tax=Hymenoscyphus fraxineus TaxID=746836 RepID=A0A9N9KNH5_9HELO|nr:hypothetical protein HYFRA_00004841 [Hymenoscyphus fraxineus]
MNGLVHANHLLGEQAFDPNDWEVIGEYVYDSTGSRHQASYAPKHDIMYKDILIKAEERVKVEESLKYSAKDAVELWEAAGLQETNHWTATSDNYSIHYLVKDKMAFHTDPAVYAKSTVPNLEDWEGLWRAWDTVTRGMLPEEELLEKPIKLRNACIFYLGHIPTFVDIQLNKVTKEPPSEPSHYTRIFERGIDPDVDNPENCHAHSEIPNEWPPLEEILQYQTAVRSKIRKICKSSHVSRDIGRALWMGFEHEILHLETLLYMILQSNRTLPPTTLRPDFEGDARLAEKSRVPNEWFDIPKQTIVIGLEDPEDNSKGDVHFGWDNEKPQRKVSVPAFQAQGRAITNGEYALYLERSADPKIPVSWSEDGSAHSHVNGHHNGYSNGHYTTASKKPFLEGKFVKTVYGLVPLKFALDWPVFASYDELLGCANFMGGRIPTVEEAKSIYSHVDSLRREEAERHLGKTVPAVNGHLLNDGVEESPPHSPSQNGKSSQELFTNLEGANVGFKHWHPIAITAHGNKLAGQSEMGGVWEWTSSPLEKHDGFEPMPLYPEYTADFFDGKHNIVLGGSWATHPRIAGRRTFVNWYQRNYLYAWVGARLVRDL